MGIWDDTTKALFSCTHIKVGSSYKYLGVKLGCASPEEAFTPAVQKKAMGRALSMQHWKLEADSSRKSFSSQTLDSSGVGVPPE